MTTGSALTFVCPGRAGQGRLGMTAAVVSRVRNPNQARISCDPCVGRQDGEAVTFLAQQCLE